MELSQMCNKPTGGNYDEYYSSPNFRCRAGPIVRWGRRLLVEETKVDLTFHILTPGWLS